MGVKPTKEFPLKNYIGPIAGDLFEKQKNELDSNVNNHLKRPGKKIFFVMGSACLRPLFLKILETLNQTDFNVIAVYTTILNREDLPITKENILLKRSVTSPLEVNKKVDLAIIHGGRGTTYTAAYAGKPVIGIPMFLEHQYNIDNLVRHGSTIRISMKFFKPQELLNAIDKIFSNYDSFLTNAQQLAAKLTREAGEKKATQRLIEIGQLKHVK